MVKKINELIKNTRRAPPEGKGKPEPLKHRLPGFWSRRITEEHRLVYAVTDDPLLVIITTESAPKTIAALTRSSFITKMTFQTG